MNLSDIETNGLKFLGSGSASDVYLLDKDRVVVVGKRDDCFANYQALFKKSKLVDGRITTARYPRIHRVIRPCKKFPFGAMIEDCVQGVELRKIAPSLTEKQKQELGKRLAEFLNELHAIEFKGNKQEEIKTNLQKFDRSINLLSDYLDNKTIKKLAKVREKYDNLMKSKEFCVTHGDLNAGNIMLTKDGEFAGIIDFGNMEYYLPEVEFAHMLFYDKIIYNSMTKNYSKKLKDDDVALIELVMRIRHFKNIVNFEDKRKECLKNIRELTDKIEIKDEKLKFYVVTKKNFDDVLLIKHKLFPESNTDRDYEKHFKKLSKCNYYLIKEDGKSCATIGWYDFDDKNRDAFVGWFGVLPEFQRRGVGTKALEFILNEVRAKGYKFLRVYTDKVVNYASTKLYDKMFDFVEDYSYPDKLGKTHNFVVYTKVLSGTKEKWNNRPLNEDDCYGDL